MKKIYQLNYSTEEYNKDYGFFSSREKAEKAKQNILDNTDNDMLEFYQREINIYEIKLDVYEPEH